MSSISRANYSRGILPVQPISKDKESRNSKYARKPESYSSPRGSNTHLETSYARQDIDPKTYDRKGCLNKPSYTPGRIDLSA